MKRFLFDLLIVLSLALLVFLGGVFVFTQSTYNKALAEIKAAEDSEATGIDLRIFRLTQLPPEIATLRNLTRLYLSDNLLSSLPPEIGNLSNLTSLNLSENQLKELPAEIGNLSKLESLSVASNQLTYLPAEIGNLTSLETLWLTNNQLTRLPPEIGNLTSLTELHLSGNPFDAPQTIIAQGDWAIFNYYAAR